jgi:hypothetical protein
MATKRGENDYIEYIPPDQDPEFIFLNGLGKTILATSQTYLIKGFNLASR